MINPSQEVTCPHCSAINRWEGSNPEEALSCNSCHGFIAHHDDYIHGLVKQEISRNMRRNGHCNVSRDLSLLKLALTGDSSRLTAETLRY